MQHQDIETNNIIEKYLLHQLNDSEENAFEQHLLFCSECRQELAIMKSLIKDIRIAGETELISTTKPKPKQKVLLRYWSVAAAIIILLCVAVFIKTIKKNEVITTYETERIIAETSDSSDTSKHSVKPVETDQELPTDTPTDELLAVHFELNATFEQEIRNPLRTRFLKVLRPEVKDEIQVGDSITFIWDSPDYAKLYLVLFNNRGNVVFKQEVTQSFKLRKILLPGLYYWHLETEDEALYTGKFLIIKE